MLPPQLMGQTTEDLEKQKQKQEKELKQLEKDIAYTGMLLNETKSNSEAALIQLSLVKRQISNRRARIRTLNKQIKIMDRQIAENNDIIRALEEDLVQVKENYAKMLYYAFKNRNSYDKLVFVFSAKDFDQAQKRLKYLQDYSQYRRDQADLILSTKGLISNKNTALEKKKEQKRSKVADKNQEKKELEDEKKGKNMVYEKLQGSISKLTSELKADNKKREQLSAAIEDIIQEIIRLETIVDDTEQPFGLTPEQSKLSQGFKNNKGKLPWPVKRGVIVGGFGPHPHEFLQGIVVNNYGIDLSTNKGARARAIFEGVVTAVVILPGSNVKAIIVRHGDYFSVYGNLQEVIVRKGDNVLLKQEVGVIYTDNEQFKTVGHLEIWKMETGGAVKLDPEQWLSKKSKSN
ncbi:MAG: peptidoglycan DD-metalloendopeptidase family protein [Flavobacteriales bacterium]|nr:peptidoglycan DD-metalloendopeptidase family protein [Flavobacteriales bacterium]